MDEKGLNVFIVDDESSVVEWLLNNIDWNVYNCRVAGYASSAAEAYRYVCEHPVDLMLTDISMPEMSGLELMNAIKEKFPEMLFIVISAFDNFSYVREAFQYGIINYCLKPIDVMDLQECLKTAMQTVRERRIKYYNNDIRIFRNSFFLNLLNGEISAQRFAEQSALAGVDFNIPAWQVVLMDISGLQEADSVALLKYYREKEDRGYYSFLDANMNLVFIVYGEAVSGEGWRIRKLLKTDRDLASYCIFVSIGEPLTSRHAIATSYRKCSHFLNADFLFHKNIVEAGKYSYEKYLEVIRSSEQQLLVKALEAYDKEGTVELIQRMVKKCRTEEEKKAEIICLAVYLVNRKKGAFPERSRLRSTDCLDTQETSEKMSKWMENFCAKWIRSNEQADSFVHPSVKYVLQEVNKRYADSTLSMKELAENRGISPAYLGTIFKEQTGELFNDYLLTNRLEKVLELLGNTKLTIGEISVATGFTSQSYLNRVFRRKFGMSPMEYRRRDKQ